MPHIPLADHPCQHRHVPLQFVLDLRFSGGQGRGLTHISRARHADHVPHPGSQNPQDDRQSDAERQPVVAVLMRPGRNQHGYFIASNGEFQTDIFLVNPAQPKAGTCQQGLTELFRYTAPLI